MSPVPPDDDVEAPLDPAVERIRQRLRRLILVSSATLFVGLAAVLVAVIYKIGPVRDKPGLLSGPVEASIAGVLPAGARVVSTALDGSLLAVTIDSGGATRIVVLDLGANRIVRNLALQP